MCRNGRRSDGHDFESVRWTRLRRGEEVCSRGRRQFSFSEDQILGEVRRRRFCVEGEFRISGRREDGDFGLTMKFGSWAGWADGDFGLTLKFGF